MQFLPGSGRIDTAIWMHYMDSNKMAGEEARRQLHKNAVSNLEQVLAATPHKKHQLYGHLPSITKTIQVRQTRHAVHYWRSRDELISDVLLWTPTYGWAKAGRPAWTYIQQLCEDMGCGPEDLPESMNDREKWWERVKDIHATSTTWWWWLLCNSNNWIKSHSFVCTQLIVKTVLFLTTWFKWISHYKLNNHDQKIQKFSGRALAQHSVVIGSNFSGRDHGIHCWRDLIRLKQLSSGFYMLHTVLAGFSGHGNSIYYLLLLIIKRFACKQFYLTHR